MDSPSIGHRSAGWSSSGHEGRGGRGQGDIDQEVPVIVKMKIDFSQRVFINFHSFDAASFL